MKRRALLVVGTLALVAGGVVAWSNYENDHDETCWEQKSITYAAGSEGTQPPRREYDC